MKLTVERAALIKALGHVYRVVERRNTIPILSNVLLRAEGGELRLRATDLDIEVTESLPADVAAAGATSVPAHMLHDIVRKIPEGAQVSLELTGGQVELRSGRSRFMLGALPEGDFPDLSAGEMPTAFEVDPAHLKALLGKASFAISTEETRYYLNGIYLHAFADAEGTVLRAVATDGHRLARIQVPAPAGSERMPGVIVPKKAVAEVQKLVDEAEEPVRVELSPAKVRFTFADVVLTSKLIDGTFPDYQRVIPTGNDKELRVPRSEFAKSVDRVATVASERGRAVKLGIEPGRLTLTVTNPDSGSATEEVEVGYDAPPLDIGFNARYLMEVVGQIEGEEAELMLADPGSPTLIRDPSSDSALYVLMPMRI